MYSIRKRISILMTYMFNFTTVLLLAIFIFSHFYKPEPPKCEFYPSQMLITPLQCYINLDLSKEFHLNVKQIFLYVRINYNDVNNDVIWSEIIKRNNSKIIRKQCVSNYKLARPNSNKIVYELRGCIFPFVGVTRDVLYSRKEVFYARK